jgi:hypothetical protein
MTTLDGARYLRDDQHAYTMLCRLVAITPTPSSKPANADLPASWSWSSRLPRTSFPAY